MTASPRQRTIDLIGGSSLIGGTLIHHFENQRHAGVRVRSPNSKELGLRVPDDIRRY